MTRTDQLRELLDAALDIGDRSLAEVSEALARDEDGWSLALASFAAFMSLHHDRAVELGEDALSAASDPTALAAARGARGLASAARRTASPDSWAASSSRGDVLADAVAELGALGPGDPDDFARYLIAEAALACARLGLAEQAVTGSGPLPTGFLGGHPYLAVIGVMRARVLAFRGRIADGTAELASLEGAATVPLAELLVSGTETLMRGNAAERAPVRALADRLEFAQQRRVDHVSNGCFLLAAFGLLAIGDLRRAARMALVGGADGLAQLTIIDRALVLELLVAAALADDDLDAAVAWGDLADPLADSMIAGSTVARIVARIELACGDAEAAFATAERAIALARAEGRTVEAAEAEIVAARAHLRGARAGDAAVRLERLVSQSDPAGHLAVRRSAARELRPTGRRLRPAAGSEWSGLSARERDLALLLAEGLSNRQIGVELHLSEHTVRAHVSRVLAAFGAASRFAVAARLADLFPDPPKEPPAALTPRQDSVALAVMHGLSNAEIARDLGLSVKTVERHITDIMSRWQLSSRAQIARVARAARQAE